MSDLIERLQILEGADRGLDSEIAAWAHDRKIVIQHGAAPHYTGSIDAAIRLVPEGWMWSVHGGAGSCNGCQLDRDGDDSPDGEFICDDAANSAIAVCIAAIKASS